MSNRHDQLDQVRRTLRVGIADLEAALGPPDELLLPDAGDFYEQVLAAMHLLRDALAHLEAMASNDSEARP